MQTDRKEGKEGKEEQAEIDAETRSLMENPYIKQIIREHAERITAQALELPLQQWLQEAADHGFDGIIWFQFTHAHPDDVQALLENSAAVLALTKGYTVSIEHQGALVLVHKQPMDTAKIVPIIRACLRAY